MKLFLFTVCALFAVCAFTQNTYKEVTLAELMQKVRDKKDIVILDVRSRGEYHDTLSNNKHLNIGHIKGAINFPLQELSQRPEMIKEVEQYKDKEVYVICSHSYRSRTVSNTLTRNGFTNVNNVQGGMSEWFRNYAVLSKYKTEPLYENKVTYRNLSPEELYRMVMDKKDVQYLGIGANPRFAFDSMMISFYEHFPSVKNAAEFKLADSTAILDLAKKASGKPIVVYNLIGAAGGEIADWLSKKGISNVHYLYGNAPGLFEYLVNYRKSDLKPFFSLKNKINFYSPYSFCNNAPKDYVFVDTRHDTLFNKNTVGTKLTYKSLKNAVNFPFYKSIDEFEQKFPNKNVMYVFAPHQNYAGVAMAKQLTDRGYSIGWIVGGNERWEWYSNNVPDFKCREMLVQ